VVDLLEDVSQNPRSYITYIYDTRKYIVPHAVQNGGTYKELLAIIDESSTKHLLAQVLVITSSTFVTLVFVKCVLNLLSLEIALCSVS